MQIEISQSQQFKYSIVYVVKDAISYNCFTSIMQHFVVKNAFISRHQMVQLVFRVPAILRLQALTTVFENSTIPTQAMDVHKAGLIHQICMDIIQFSPFQV